MIKPTKNRYYLMRHGESLANRRGLIISKAENALNHHGLTSKGAEQVMTAAMNTRLDYNTVIVSSDYKRALETAEIVHSVLACKTDLVLEPRLRERDFGSWELSDHSNYEAVWQHDLNQPLNTVNEVESVDSVLNRGLAVIKELEQTYSEQSILLVGHGDVLQIQLAYNHNINPRFHRSLSSIGNADIRSLAKLELMSRSPAA